MHRTTIAVTDTSIQSADAPGVDKTQAIHDLPTTAKIAFVSDDGVTLNRHFGHAENYLVVTMADGQIMSREMRVKLGHGNHDHDHDHGHGHGHGHGRGHGHGNHHDHGHHASMLAPIADCQVLIAGGMGFPVRDAVHAMGLTLILSVPSDIDQILADYVSGELVHNPRLAHRPGLGHHD